MEVVGHAVPAANAGRYGCRPRQLSSNWCMVHAQTIVMVVQLCCLYLTECVMPAGQRRKLPGLSYLDRGDVLPVLHT